ncbi:MAG: hypothetical protein AAF901_13690, partial [Bacteroidota bacterium]
SGNCSNCSDTQYEQPLNARYQKFNQNSIIFSYNPDSWRESRGYWALGWRFERLMYVKYTMTPRRGGPQNGAYFISWGAGLRHVNWSQEIRSELSLVTSAQLSYGKRIGFLGIRYLYITARLNSHFYEDSNFELDQPLTLIENNSEKLKYTIWPGYTVGIQI